MSLILISKQLRLQAPGMEVVDSPKCLLEWLKTHKVVGFDIETTGLDSRTSTVLLISIGDAHTRFVIDCQTVHYGFLVPFLESEEHLKVIHNSSFDCRFMLAKLGVRVKRVYDTMLGEMVLFAGHKLSKRKGQGWNSLANILRRRYRVSLQKDLRQHFYKGSYVLSSSLVQYAAEDIQYLPQLCKDQSAQFQKLGLVQVAKLEMAAAAAYIEIEHNGLYMDAEYWQANIINKYEGVFRQVVEHLEEAFLVECEKFEGLKKYIFRGTQVITKGSGRNKKSVTIISTEANLFYPARDRPFITANWGSGKQMLSIFKLMQMEVTDRSGKEGSGDAVIRKYLSRQYAAMDRQDVEGKLAHLESYTGEYQFQHWFELYRITQHILNIYGPSLMARRHSMTGRLHPSYFQLGAATGRVSCGNPNIQNQPKDNLFRHGYKVQKAENWLICLDYANIELRIMAEAANETTMLKGFASHEDVHSLMATIMFGVTVSKKENSKLRDKAKTVNFGLAYGAQAQKFAPYFEPRYDLLKPRHRKLAAHEQEYLARVAAAQDFIDNVYFKQFPALKEYFENESRCGQEHGYTRTQFPFHRVRWYPSAQKARLIMGGRKFSKDSEFNAARRELAGIGRAAKNHPIQGTAADVMKLATVRVYQWIARENAFERIKLVAQVHDELLLEVCGTEAEAQAIMGTVESLMVKAGSEICKKVVLEVEGTCGKIWSK